MNQYKFAELYDRDGDLSKRWYVGYSFLHPETGKYQLFQEWISSRLKTKHSRRVRANQIIDQINSKLRNGFNPFQKENIAFTNIIDAVKVILSYKASYTKYRTICTDNSCCNLFFSWLKMTGNDKLTIESFNYQLAVQFSDYLKTERKLSNRTFNNYKERISTIFNNLVEREYILNNPFKRIKKLPETQRSVFAYTNSELSILKKYLPSFDPQLWLVCQLIYYCALRPAEIVKLKIRDLNIDRKLIILPGEITKNRQNSIIRIPDPLYQMLQHRDFSKYDPGDFVFSKKLLPGAVYIFPTRLAEKFRKFANLYGLKRNLYELKHTAIGKALQNGSNINDIKYHCRHSDIKMTEVYLRAFQSNTSDTFVNNFPEM